MTEILRRTNDEGLIQVWPHWRALPHPLRRGGAIGCAIYLFSVSQVEAALDRSWFPFAQLQALTAGMDGKTPESVCLVLAALPVFGLSRSCSGTDCRRTCCFCSPPCCSIW
ncbi:MAG: hypothetical protein ACLUEK_09770 [Oscillospiraceae bacterium]